MRSIRITPAVLRLLAAILTGMPGRVVALSGPDMMRTATFAGPRLHADQELRRGEAALQGGDFRDAKDAFNHVIELKPGDPDAWYDLGQAATGLGETRSASQAYARSVALDPKSIDARRELALSLIKLKQSQKAAAQLDALKASAAACKDPCLQVYEFRIAIATVQDAMSN